MKWSCGIWLAVYLLLAAAIGAITYRRFPHVEAAAGAAIIGGGVAWLGIAYFFGIKDKYRAAALIQRGLDGDAPRDGEKVAAIGRLSAAGQLLVSPLSRSSCIAYKYEINSRSGDDEITYYSGFAMTPSSIQTRQQSIRLLAWSDPKLKWVYVPASDGQRSAEEYIAATEFREPAILNIRQSFSDLMAMYRDDDGTVRWDQRGVRPPLDTNKPIDLSAVTYREMLLRPSDPVCVIGRYSAQRGGIVPSDHPLADPVTLELGEREAFIPRATAGAVGYLIGGTIFLSVIAIAFIVFHALVPLDAAERMAPNMVASWPEIRLERLLDMRVRPMMRNMGMLDSSQVMIQIPPGTANGRVKSDGREEVVAHATAQRDDAGNTTVTIDDRAVVLTISATRKPIRFAILGKEIAPAAAAIRIDEMEKEVAGRVTYLPDDDSAACRVTFRAGIMQ
jgi:hypothetical protein